MPSCALCGEPMPAGEEMFKYHGYSGECPKPPLPKPPPPKAEFKTQQYGAVVATIHETPDEIVEVTANRDGRYDLVIHSRRPDRDQWDDLTAHLSAEQFEALGTVAAHMRANQN